MDEHLEKKLDIIIEKLEHLIRIFEKYDTEVFESEEELRDIQLQQGSSRRPQGRS